MLTAATTTRQSVILQLENSVDADWLEEMLWTLPEIDSIEHRFDGETVFLGMEVIGRSEQLEQAITQLLQQLDVKQTVKITAHSVVQEDDWAESWKRHWHVNRILPHVIIQPSWETYTPQAQDLVLHLDPGSAFGTGTHETTQLMLYLMSQLLDKPSVIVQTCVDVGTGSGVLAIFAAKKQVPTVIALDNDPLAVQVALENCTRNQVHVACTNEPITTALEQTPAAGTQADLIVANILARVLGEMMHELAAHLAPHGTLLLSGINTEQLPEMQNYLQQNRLKLTQIVQKGGWIALACQHS